MEKEINEMTDGPLPPVVILCGGQGLRLGPTEQERAKPLVIVGDRPILRHVMEIYAVRGFTRFILCLGYKGDAIREYFSSHHFPESWRVELVDTGLKANTGARVKRIQHVVDTPDFMLTYADGVCDLDPRELLAFHRAHGCIGTVTAVRPPNRFGVLALEGTEVVRFSEKPKMTSFINGGFFVMRREFFDCLSDNEECVLEREPLERLARKSRLHAFCHEGFWQCMDTPKDVALLNELWSSGQARWAAA